MVWKYAPGDMVELRDGGGVYSIAVQEQIREKGKMVPVYEGMPVSNGRIQGAVRLIRDTAILGKFEHEHKNH